VLEPDTYKHHPSHYEFSSRNLHHSHLGLDKPGGSGWPSQALGLKHPFASLGCIEVHFTKTLSHWFAIRCIVHAVLLFAPAAPTETRASEHSQTSVASAFTRSMPWRVQQHKTTRTYPASSRAFLDILLCSTPPFLQNSPLPPDPGSRHRRLHLRLLPSFPRHPPSSAYSGSSPLVSSG
jgi:hypothetical protein